MTAVQPSLAFSLTLACFRRSQRTSSRRPSSQATKRTLQPRSSFLSMGACFPIRSMTKLSPPSIAASITHVAPSAVRALMEAFRSNNKADASCWLFLQACSSGVHPLSSLASRSDKVSIKKRSTSSVPLEFEHAASISAVWPRNVFACTSAPWPKASTLRLKLPSRADWKSRSWTDRGSSIAGTDWSPSFPRYSFPVSLKSRMPFPKKPCATTLSKESAIASPAPYSLTLVVSRANLLSAAMLMLPHLLQSSTPQLETAPM
mmetsp:Transcript_80703/g.231822  ORF Transcript_80703/g.231822 Transcript_80703/m.231822 type:complete len:261 (+) Transcript_80703:460-1242(+)